MDVNNGKVSVIIPIYNRQDVIEECLSSVFSQTYQNFEVVLVDDGSTDQTLPLCEKLVKDDSRIKLFAVEHGGVSAARNKALDVAEGEYVFFLDSDDVIYPALLETLVTAMKTHNTAIGGTAVRGVPQEIWHRVAEKCKEPLDVGETQYNTVAETIDAVFVPSPLNVVGGVMMRRDWIGDTRFRTDLFIGEDYYFIYENVIKGADSVFLKQKWYFARLHQHNSSWNWGFSGFWSRFYRRELVWKSEESFGRIEHVDWEKRDAFSCFLDCFSRNNPYSEDGKKMRRVLREYKKTLLPALTRNGKILYLLCLYCPYIARAVLKRHSSKQSHR